MEGYQYTRWGCQWHSSRDLTKWGHTSHTCRSRVSKQSCTRGQKPTSHSEDIRVPGLGDLGGLGRDEGRKDTQMYMDSRLTLLKGASGKWVAARLPPPLRCQRQTFQTSGEAWLCPLVSSGVCPTACGLLSTGLNDKWHWLWWHRRELLFLQTYTLVGLSYSMYYHLF